MKQNKKDKLNSIATKYGKVNKDKVEKNKILYQGKTYNKVITKLKIPTNKTDAELFKKELKTLVEKVLISNSDIENHDPVEGPLFMHNNECIADLDSLFDFTKSNIRGFINDLENEPSNRIIDRRLDIPSFVAFYRQFHYSPDDWGIYLDISRLAQRATMILSFNDNPNNPNKLYNLSYDDCLLISFFKTYYHEMYHHKFEMMATKFEILYRKPFYVNGFNYYYCKTFRTDSCLEEAFANVFGMNKAIEILKSYELLNYTNSELKYLIRESMLKNSPPGYRVSYELTNDKISYEEYENKFIEFLFQFSYKRIFDNKPDDLPENYWELFTYKLDPLVNTDNDVTFILPDGW